MGRIRKNCWKKEYEKKRLTTLQSLVCCGNVFLPLTVRTLVVEGQRRDGRWFQLFRLLAPDRRVAVVVMMVRAGSIGRGGGGRPRRRRSVRVKAVVGGTPGTVGRAFLRLFYGRVVAGVWAIQ